MREVVFSRSEIALDTDHVIDEVVKALSGSNTVRVLYWQLKRFVCNCLLDSTTHVRICLVCRVHGWETTTALHKRDGWRTGWKNHEGETMEQRENENMYACVAISSVGLSPANMFHELSRQHQSNHNQ